MRVSRELLDEPKYSTHDAVAQHGNVEVDEKADLPAAQTQIGEKLGFMDGRQSFHRLDFHDDGVRHKQAGPEQRAFSGASPRLRVEIDNSSGEKP